MKRNGKYLILPSIQGLGVAVIFWMTAVHVPKDTRVPLAQVGLIMLQAVLFMVIGRMGFILLSSYIINISKIIYYKINKKIIISGCLFPVFWQNKKISIANFFWIYDDRTCFEMNEYLLNKDTFFQLGKFIEKRNRFLAGVYVIIIAGILILFNAGEWYLMSWIFFWGAAEHFHYQWEYKTIETANGMAFAGLRHADNRLLLHILVNQSKFENLDIGDEVAELLAEERYDRDGGYFFNYLCLSSMFAGIKQENQFNQGNALRKYMDEKVDNIMNETEDAMNLVKYSSTHPLYKNINKRICLFFDHYREFLLYVLMYYSLQKEELRYGQLKRYIEYMLREIDEKCVNDSVLSDFVLSEKFYEYQDLFHQVLERQFTPETSIFTGYDTLPLWKKDRQDFIDKYNRNAEDKNGECDVCGRRKCKD